ncbi:MAG: Eco57I restriction-modification methylase domain-containing protein [Spirochaetales bacterium]|nr:Eco57I restriction-modification methylase domain-containing protein [Spirochaetales bacterium]
MENLRTLFENEYPGKKVLFESLIKPIFVKANDTTLTDEQELSDSDKKQIKSFRIIAQVRGSFPITFADVELQDNVALKRSRVNIQNCVRKVMENDSNAIIFFHFADNLKEWRVSYVNKADSLKNSTSAKRYTYLCGPEHSCRTIAERFSTLKGLSTIRDEKMLEAFSVAPLSDDFFNEYREHYADLVEYISGKRFVKKGGKFIEEKTKNPVSEFSNAFNGDDKAVRDFVKKMMGRLVFLQFLQKKGWLGVQKNAKWGAGDKNFIYNLFKNADDSVKNDFLEQALEPLFFKSLNCDRGEEAIAPKAVCSIYGSEIRIPYLNGGLFEADELDKKKVKFKKEHFESLFEFFNQYNFTIDETDPDDVEIGVDPEMLGKIFENLLEDNKDKGAFYTPKEIVQYMCRESLIAYLETETVKTDENDTETAKQNRKDKIRNFVLNHDASSFSEKEKADILKALIDVKICDPAVGSGAFPMGMLNELLSCTQILTGEAKTRAELKKHIVKNNIYGVDIEKGAVDIARLRFWLAIIVDEEEPLPLPNLDYKIMQGNSLLESFEGIDLSDLTTKKADELFDDADDVKCLVTTLQKYFDTSDHNAKTAHREAIKSAVLDLLEKRGISTAENRVKTELKKLDLHENSQFFLWHTWFYDVFNRPNDCNRNGFDIVIGNPPYISAPTQLANKFLAEQREKISKSNKYKSLYQKWDLYIPFIELGLNLNCRNGITTMIVPFPLTNQLYAKILREMIVKENNMFELVDLNGTKIFDNATVSNCIPFIEKVAPKEKTWISHIDEKLEIRKIFEQPFSALVQDEKTQVWNVTQQKREANKYSDFHVLGDFCYVSYGLRPNSDEKTAKGEFKKEDLISDVKDNIPRRKYIEAKDIEKYKINRIRYLEYGTDRSPAKLTRPTFEELYNHNKIMFNVLGDLTGTFDDKKLIHNHSLIACVLWNSLKCVENKSIASSIKKYSKYSRQEMEKLSETVDLKFLLGIMNSKYASVLLTNLRGGDYHIYPEHIRNIPIPAATPAKQQAIIALVDKILATKKQDSSVDTNALESKIDELVYKLYEVNNI